MACRLHLIDSVISGITSFWCSTFILPQRVIKRINSLSSSFLWHGISDNPSGARVSWQDISQPKSEGGLGLRNLSSWNETCGLKLIWMLFFRGGSIWVAWVRRSYLSNASFWSLNATSQNFSWMFRKLLRLRQKALTFLSI